MRVKSSGMAPGLANALLPGSAKFTNAPPPGLTRRANAPQYPGGGWVQVELTDSLQSRFIPSVKMKIGPYLVANLAQWGVKTNVLSVTKSVPLCLKWNFLPDPFWILGTL